LFKNDRIKIKRLQSAAVFMLDGCVICDDEEAGNETKSYAILDSPTSFFLRLFDSSIRYHHFERQNE